MKEKYSQWSPVEVVDRNTRVKSIRDGNNGLRFRLEDSWCIKEGILVNFGRPFEYRILDPAIRKNENENLLQIYKDFYKDWNFFIVENSNYIKQTTERLGVVFGEKVQHFHIKHVNYIIDIIAVPPKVGVRHKKRHIVTTKMKGR